jgi:hypothetical protein
MEKNRIWLKNQELLLKNNALGYTIQYNTIQYNTI